MQPLQAMDASLGGEGTAADEPDFPTGPAPVFPRLGVRDPYKRLGVSRDASNEEIQDARNYLVEQYKGHEKSKEAIESAHDRIIMEKLRLRKGSKINLKANLKKKVGESPAWVQALANRIESPKPAVIAQRGALFLAIGAWSVINSAEGGPAFQVAVALGLCIYFLNERIKSLGRAFLLGLGALLVGWVLGSIIVPLVPPFILPRYWSLELITSLISYVFLWLATTFLK
eukprot:SM000099S25204  [mRNA]  locus=s99:178055:179912:- [translate_table: standard]